MRNSCGRPAAPVLSLILLALAMPGCRGTPAMQGQHRDIVATYRYRRLTADLPATIRIPAAIAAAQSVLRARGYAITGTTSTEDKGDVRAEPADAGPFESAWVGARKTASGTRVEVLVEPTGNQVRSRAILDAMLATLGL